MKILLISQELLWEERLKRILSMDKIEADSVILDKNFTFDDQRFKPYSIVIFNRLKINLDPLIKYFRKRELFILCENVIDLKINDRKLFNKKYQKVFTHPINYSLLCLEIKSVHVYRQLQKDSFLKYQDIELDLNTRILACRGKKIFLKNKEFELAKYLIMNKGKILTRLNILENVWDMNANVLTNTVDVHVSKLRSIIKKEFDLENIIKTIQCIGYTLS